MRPSRRKIFNSVGSYLRPQCTSFVLFYQVCLAAPLITLPLPRQVIHGASRRRCHSQSVHLSLPPALPLFVYSLCCRARGYLLVAGGWTTPDTRAPQSIFCPLTCKQFIPGLRGPALRAPIIVFYSKTTHAFPVLLLCLLSPSPLHPVAPLSLAHMCVAFHSILV